MATHLVVLMLHPKALYIGSHYWAMDNVLLVPCFIIIFIIIFIRTQSTYQIQKYNIIEV